MINQLQCDLNNFKENVELIKELANRVFHKDTEQWSLETIFWEDGDYQMTIFHTDKIELLRYEVTLHKSSKIVYFQLYTLFPCKHDRECRKSHYFKEYKFEGIK